MLVQGSQLNFCRILSLHVGGEVARVIEPIIDPNTLKLIALRVDGPLVGQDDTGDLLPVESIREYSQLGMVIDSSDDFVNAEDVVRLQKIIQLNFALPGLKVVTKSGAKIGKVSDYVLNAATWEIYQLIVQRPVFKSLLDPELTIARSQILEVDDYKVVIKDEYEHNKTKLAVPKPSEFVADFVNPFRQPDFAKDA